MRPTCYALMVLALLAVISAGCETTYPEHLASLQGDPLATVQLPGAERSTDTTDDARTALSRPVAATILRRFHIEEEADPDRVRDEAIDAARAAGWSIEDPAAERVEGTKEFATGNADVAIYFLDATKADLIVLIQHDRPVPQTER